MQVKEILRVKGHRLLSAVTGEEGLAKVATEAPDVVLTGHDPSERRAEFRPRQR